MSSIISEMMKDESDLNLQIPLPNVRSDILIKVIDFCTHYKAEPMNEIEKPLKSGNMTEIVQPWYSDFVNVEHTALFEMILAANYMNIQPLLDLTSAAVAAIVKGKNPEEIRKSYNITNDFTPEEEAQAHEEKKCCE